MPFDFDAVSSPFRMQPGLRRIAPGALQLTPNGPHARALREKLAVLSSYAHQALVEDGRFDAGPALQALAAHAAAEHPSALAIGADGAWHARRLDWSVRGDAVDGDGAPEIGRCLAALPPRWRGAGLLSLAFAQDYALLDGRSGRVPWMAVCLPSHWAPEEKVGRTFPEIHAPVADNALLIAASDALVRLVTGADRWERYVWTITADPRLHQHPLRSERVDWPADAGSDALAAAAFLRTEHQTFIPLPALQQAVFTIHVESRPLASALASPAQAGALRDALATMSDAVLDYRGLTAARDRLLAWLDGRAAAAPSSPTSTSGDAG